jgi:hypothetical protein
MNFSKDLMNRHSVLAGILYLFAPTLCHTTDHFEIVLKSKWRPLDNNAQHEIDFGGKWVLVGGITFKKKSKDPLFIDSLCLRWHGAYLDNVIASLYKKTPSKEFLPIENNLVCDWTWNKTKQVIMFNFSDKETLHPTTTFYLVLTIPPENEQLLKNGTFSLEEQCLPKPFKQSLQTMQLSLTIQAPYQNQSVSPTT